MTCFKGKRPTLDRSPIDHFPSAQQESNPPVQGGGLAPLPLGHGHTFQRAVRVGIEPTQGRLTGACPYQQELPHNEMSEGHQQSAWLDSNQRSPASGAGGISQAFPHAD